MSETKCRYQMILAGTYINVIAHEHPQLESWCLKPGAALYSAAAAEAEPAVYVPREFMERKRPVFQAAARGPLTDELLEYELLVFRISDALMSHGAVLFHGTAFEYEGNAWILTGPSGVGKTTQYRNLRTLLGDRVRILNGDKPVLKFESDRIMVHPSPWHGKEGYGRGASAPLAGIITLRQAPADCIRRLEPGEAVWPVLSQILHSGEDLGIVSRAAEFADRILSRVPVWELENRGGPASAELTRRAIAFE